MQGISGNNYVNLTWQASLYNGDSALIGYNIYRDDILINTTDGSTLFYSDTSLNIGNYSYYITAVNVGRESAKSNIFTTMVTTVPSNPRNLQLTVGFGRVDVTWEVPASDGNSPITAYTIYRDDVALATVGADIFVYYDISAVNGDTYDYAVSAINAHRRGK